MVDVGISSGISFQVDFMNLRDSFAKKILDLSRAKKVSPSSDEDFIVCRKV